MSGDGRMTPEEFAAKVQWEGGVLDALEYGLRSTHLDDSNPALKGGWMELETLWMNFEPLLVGVEVLIEQIGEADD